MLIAITVQGNGAGQHLSGSQRSHQPSYQRLAQTDYKSPQQAPFQPELQGNYQIHDMQCAYPSSTQGRYSPLPKYQPIPQTQSPHEKPIMTDRGFHNPLQNPDIAGIY